MKTQKDHICIKREGGNRYFWDAPVTITYHDTLNSSPIYSVVFDANEWRLIVASFTSDKELEEAWKIRDIVRQVEEL